MSYTNTLNFQVIKQNNKKSKILGSGRRKGTEGKVEPIRNLESLKKMRTFFLDKFNNTSNKKMKIISLRNHLLFVVGLNTGLRISDIFNLTFKDLSSTKYTIKEKKTGKYNTRYINSDIENTVELYLKTLDELSINYKKNDKAFVKFESDDEDNIFLGECMTTQNFIKILKSAAVKCGIEDNVGTHTMRKTFSYWFLMNNRDDSRALTLLCSILNHSSERVTLAYAGISDDEYKNIFDDTSKFYRNIDKGIETIYKDKIMLSQDKIEELIRYSYFLGKEHNNSNSEIDLDNINILYELLSDLILK